MLKVERAVERSKGLRRVAASSTFPLFCPACTAAIKEKRPISATQVEAKCYLKRGIYRLFASAKRENLASRSKLRLHPEGKGEAEGIARTTAPILRYPAEALGLSEACQIFDRKAT
jgi:hypothetical protein